MIKNMNTVLIILFKTNYTLVKLHSLNLFNICIVFYINLLSSLNELVANTYNKHLLTA